MTGEMILCISKIIPERRRGKEKRRDRENKCLSLTTQFKLIQFTYFTRLNTSNIMKFRFTRLLFM